MEYCSYEDAFPKIGPSSTGCKDQKGSDSARKEERRKAKRCKGPPLTFLDLDPDRPAVTRLADIPAMNEQTGLREHTPVDAPQAEPFQDLNTTTVPYDLTSQHQRVGAGLVARNSLPTIQKNALSAKSGSKTPSYFGASVEEGFETAQTDTIGTDSSYRLFPDFKDAFQHAAGRSMAAGGVAPIPSVVDQWKPLTPTGANTAFIDELPAPGGTYPPVKEVEFDHKTVSKKLDLLFSRLDDLESNRGENTQTEILLFVMSGLFVVFSMDILTRQAMVGRLR